MLERLCKKIFTQFPKVRSDNAFLKSVKKQSTVNEGK